MKKVFYVAGPYRAKTERGVIENIRAAEAVSIDIWESGHIALCPHMNTRLFGGILPDDVWLDGALELMKRCDAVVLVPGWEKSEGTKFEIEKAESMGMLIYSTYNKIYSALLSPKMLRNII